MGRGEGAGGSVVEHHIATRALRACLSFEMLIPGANILSHLKPVCHLPGGFVTECPEGPPANDAGKYWGGGQAGSP